MTQSEKHTPRPLQVYVETSVFGFLFDTIERNAWRREVTKRFFDQIAEKKIAAFISSFTLAELNETGNADLRQKMLAIATKLELLPDVDEEELHRLAEKLIAERAIPENAADDAFHIAAMTLNPGLDALVTWNCRHLANQNNIRYLKSIIINEGYSFHFELVTPPEVLVYD